MSVTNKKIKVLLVEDKEDIRKTTCYALRIEGFTVQEAGDGREALEIVSRRKPQIIILDVAMPGMDGIQACKRLRGNPDTQDIPIIFLSAQKIITEIIQNFPGAAIEFIEKPCDLDYLFARINSLVGKQASA